MRIKRFTAPDMAQALRQVREALGAEAVILSTGKLPGGGVEVSAAVDNPETASAKAEGYEPAPASATAFSALARRLEGLNQTVTRHLLVSEAAAGFAARPEVAPLYHHLSGQEVAPEVIAELMDGLAAPEGHGLWARLSIRLKKMLDVSGPPRLGRGGPTVWALVGPTGVGKTTTVAKLAATFALRHRLRVGMVTVDTFRMAAAQQLEVYGRIMEVPTLVAATTQDMAQAMQELSACDLILVDTAGRAPGDEENLAELEALLAAVPQLSCHLVLACPTRNSDQDKVVESFARFAPRTLIFTKLDETDTFGAVLNQVRRTGLPVSYLTFGQKVPDDLEEATREGLARRLLPVRRDPSLPQEGV